MTTNIKIYSERDLKRMIKKEIGLRFYSYELILNRLKNRLIDIEKIMDVEPISIPSISPHKLKDSFRKELK